MKLQINRLLLVLVVALLAFVRGEEYSAMVSQVEEIDEEGVCHKLVTITGNGIKDKIPVRCDMANYMVTNDKQLVVGDKIYSDKVDSLMVLTPQGCEQRTYTDGALAKITQLQDDKCEEVKLSMMKVYMNNEDNDDDDNYWSLDSDSSDSNDEVSEDQLNAYDDLRKWVSEYMDDDGTDEESEEGDSKYDDKSFW